MKFVEMVFIDGPSVLCPKTLQIERLFKDINVRVNSGCCASHCSVRVRCDDCVVGFSLFCVEKRSVTNF